MLAKFYTCTPAHGLVLQKEVNIALLKSTKMAELNAELSAINQAVDNDLSPKDDVKDPDQPGSESTLLSSDSFHT